MIADSSTTDSPNAARERFKRDGYLIARQLLDPSRVAEMRALAAEALAPLAAPVEYEAEVGYPGAPADRWARGGDTPRRLLYAFARHPAYRLWATGPEVGAQLALVSGTRDWLVSQCHHNCIMTKAPGYSSETQWHQDIRYWSFDHPELISVWLALGRETKENGSLRVIPGSHSMSIDRGRLDRALFLRPELPDNQALIKRAVAVELEPGDALLFHCRTFHAAGRNATADIKLSCVFTYHRNGNRPIPGTRSATYESVPVAS